MVPRVAQKDTGPKTNHGSWWIVDDAKFAEAVMKRSGDSWGQFKDIPSTSLAHGENEITRPRAPKPSEFAPGKK